MRGSKILKRLVVLFGTGMIVLTAGYYGMMYYPPFSQDPNFTDVERVFNRMQFPSEWVEIDSSENRGYGGRVCPIESGTRCFHKSKRFKVEKNLNITKLEKVMNSSCAPIKQDRRVPVGGDPYTNFSCSTEGLELSGTLYERSGVWELSVSIYS